MTNIIYNGIIVNIQSQMLLCYGSMLKLLDSYPFLRDNYFSVGQFKEKKATEDDRPLDNIAQQGFVLGLSLLILFVLTQA